MSKTPHDDATATQPQPDLKALIHARRAELIKVLVELKSDTGMAAAEARDKLKARLSELAHVVKWGVVDDWASLGYKVKNRLEHWLAESKGQLPTQGGPARTTQS